MNAANLSRVTVVVIAYNEEARIAGCLAALLAQQNCPPFEIVVVNDGSSDRTAQIAARFGPPVKVLTLDENRGRGAARAAGVAAADGGIVGFVDADVHVPANWLRRCLDALDDAAAVSGVAVPDGDVAPLARVSGAAPRPVRGSMPITGNNVLFAAGILDRFPFPDEARLGEDFRLASRLLAAGQRLVSLEDLHVTHHEAKRYAASLRWLFASGRDASALLREFGRWRVPDVAFALFAVTSIAAVPLAVFGCRAALLLPAAVAFAVSAAHTVTRFRPRPFAAFVRAALLNVPLTVAYLAGRLVGTVRR